MPHGKDDVDGDIDCIPFSEEYLGLELPGSPGRC